MPKLRLTTAKPVPPIVMPVDKAAARRYLVRVLTARTVELYEERQRAKHPRRSA